MNDTALISSAGVVTAVRNGKVTVRATSNADDSKYAEKVIVLINQIRLVSGISLGSNTSITTKKGSLQLTAVVTPTDAADKTVSWSIDNTAIATISSTGKLTALGTTDGTVVVTATANDASKTKGTLTVTISNQHTNVNNSEVANNVYIYPNPAADAITIISGNTSFKCIEIFNVNGKLMNRLQNIAAGSKINVSKLPSGVYMVRLTDATKASVIKYFVKM